MKLFGKSINYWWEVYGGLFVGIAVAFLLYQTDPHLSSWAAFVKEVLSMGMCAFGFLLTLLSLILQGNSSTIEWMKSRKGLFDRFIQYNKQVVLLSLLISIYAYILGYTDFQWIISSLHMTHCPLISVIRRLTIGTFGGLIVWFLINTLQFIKMFYLLIKESK